MHIPEISLPIEGFIERRVLIHDQLILELRLIAIEYVDQLRSSDVTIEAGLLEMRPRGGLDLIWLVLPT
jgi:hypothetical protein